MAYTVGYNPIQSQRLLLPAAYVEDVTALVRSKGEGASPDDDAGTARFERQPFGRMVDVWAASIAFCVATRLSPMSDSEVRAQNPHRFVDGSVLKNDLHLIALLEMLTVHHAVEVQGEVDVQVALKSVHESTNIADIANGYAFAGLPPLLEEISMGSTPLLGLFQAFEPLSEAAVERHAT